MNVLPNKLAILNDKLDVPVSLLALVRRRVRLQAVF